MTLLVISSLMIAPALAQALTQTQDQQTQTTSPGYVAAADETPSTVAATEEGSDKKVIVGNKDTKRHNSSGMSGHNKVKKNNQKKVVIGNRYTKRYHLFGMPTYNNVSKDRRIYFDSEEQAIALGYHKAGTSKDSTGSVLLAGGETKDPTILVAADPAGSEKSPPEVLQKAESEKSAPEASQENEKKLETKEKDPPKTVEEPQKLKDENIQKKTVNKEPVAAEPMDINQKIQELQKQVDTLKEQGRTRDKLSVTAEEKAEQEKAVLTAAGRDYTLMQKGKVELDYTLRYEYVSANTIETQLGLITGVEGHANHTIRNIIDIQYGVKNNITTDISIPYVYVYDKTGSATARDNSDMGDITLEMDFQPFKSGGDRPTTTITMAAILPTGRSPYEINRDTDLPTGNGFYAVSLGMNLSKAIDPAMAFGGISATYRLDRNGLCQNINGNTLDEVDPGMSFNAAIGLAYAISYALSMNVQFQYGYNMKTDYHYSNTAAVSTAPAYSTGSLVIGAGWRWSPLTTLSFSLGIGLTKDDPDFYFMFRLPFTF
jgi:hypothetical protein